ncbi:MAG: carboxypeptidase M32 [Clostridiales bacterium]|nr:carboxypeptidase M32 [Clostridiales bacterium]
MKTQEMLQKLKELEQIQYAYQYAMGVTSFDGNTVAPKNSYKARGQAMSVLSGETYKKFINNEVKELLYGLQEKKKELDFVSNRKVEKYIEEYEKISKIPIKEFMEFTKLRNESNHSWEQAKTNDDFDSFAPYLTKIIEFNKRFANYRKPEKKAYDVLLDDFEKGMEMDDIDKFFEQLKKDVVPSIKEVVSKSAKIRDDFLNRKFPIDKQKELSYILTDLLNMNRDDYTIGESEHPFTMGLNNNDVRFTTHYYGNQIASSFYSTMHEAGHAIYGLNSDEKLNTTVLAGGASNGIHESQSRFYENLIGRSKEFIQYVFPTMKKLFPEQLGDVTALEFYLAVNKPKTSLIRIEADELTYSLHIMVRYEIERMMFEGDVNVKDLPAIWNKKYEEYLGIIPPNNTQGILQDVHWGFGMMGYFPSYALGSAYASQFLAKMKETIKFDSEVAKGDFTKINLWLKENIQTHGAIYTPKQLIMKTCGEEFNPAYYADYLNDKFKAL